MALLFNLLWGHASRGGRLLDRHADPEQTEAITRSYALGPMMYLASFAMAFWKPGISVVMALAYAVFWAMPNQNPIIKRRAA
jgi:hypothetical protein